MKEKFIAGIKVLLFVGIGMVLFLRAQDILKVKYEEQEIQQFYALEENMIDAVFLGTSHMENGYSPMQVFEDYGLSTYNLASSGQPIEISYVLAKEAINAQHPQVIILDASNLFFELGSSNSWRRIFDAIPYSDHKKEVADVFEKYFKKNEGETTFGVLVPFYRYHDRWKELSKEDFYTDISEYSTMGHWIGNGIRSPWMDVQWMNEELASRENEIFHSTVIKGERIEEKEEVIEHVYKPEVPNKNIDWLKKIKKVCDESNIKLLVTKIPSVEDPEWYSSAWTRQRSDILRKLCEENQIDYLDLLYDETDYELDLFTDFNDGGAHLNVRGGMKVSQFFGKYLQEHYGIKPKDNVKFYEKKEMYDEIRDQALLRTEQNFGEYLNRMHAYKERGEIILMIASADMISRLEPAYIEQLRKLGLQMDYSRYPIGAYVVQIQDGEIKYEMMSELNIKHKIKLQDITIDVDVTGKEGTNYCNLEVTYDEKAKKYNEELEDIVYQRYDSNFTFLVYDEEDNEIRDCASFVFQDEFTIGRAS